MHVHRPPCTDSHRVRNMDSHRIGMQSKSARKVETDVSDAKLCSNECWNSLTLLSFTLLASFLHLSRVFSSCFLPSLISLLPSWGVIPSFIRFFPSFIPARTSFSRVPSLAFSSSVVPSSIMLAWFLYFCLLAAFTFARLLPLILLACFTRVFHG